MPLVPAQKQFYLYGWQNYPWASSPRPLQVGLTAVPTAAKAAATVLVTLPTGSQAGKVTALAGRNSGAPNLKSPSAQVASGGSVTLPITNLQTGKLYYVRGEVVYADGTQALTPVETQVTPT